MSLSIKKENIHETAKTSEGWQILLQLRQSFQGTNIEFYKRHNLSLNTYYQRRVQLGFNTLNVEPIQKNHEITGGSIAPRFMAFGLTLTLRAEPDEYARFSFNIKTKDHFPSHYY